MKVAEVLENLNLGEYVLDGEPTTEAQFKKKF